MTNLRRAGAYELGSAFVMMPRAYEPGDEVEALAGLREKLAVEVRTVPTEGGVVRRASVGP
jgi:hypothetical protein